MAKRVVILGAGYAGVEAALKFNKKGRKDDVEIVLIDKNPYHTLLTELHEVAGNRVGEESIRIPLRDIFRDTRVKVVTDLITGFDFKGKALTSETASYPYDYLVLAIGSSPNYYGIKGLKEHAFPLWSWEDAVRIRDHIESCFVRASQEEDEAVRRSLLTFVVIGAGFTGVEMIGELVHWSKKLCKEHGVDRREVRLVNADMADMVLPTLGGKNSAKAHRYMEKKGIEVILGACVQSMDAEAVHFGDSSLSTRTVIWAAGIRSASEVDETGLPTIGGPRRIKVDAFCRTQEPDVYAIGDVGGLADENGRPYAAMVENALQTAQGCVKNILADIRGQEPKPVKVKFHGTMVCIGNYYAVSDIMGRSLPSWLSIAMKFMVNAHYLFEIRGLDAPWNYFHDEILHRRQKTSFLQRHYTKMQPSWWGTLMRMFLGGWWFYEGVKKITDGWFASPKLAAFLGVADSGAGATSSDLATKLVDIASLDLKVLHPMLGQEIKLATIATSTLTSAESMADLAKVTDVTELFKRAVEASNKLFFKMEVLHIGSFNLMDWIVRNIVVATPGLAMFFQVLVVIMQVLVGLMLLGGCFTFLGSVISLALLFMFMTTTGIYSESWWMVFASIACMGGVGRAFGLDAYVLPWLSRVWESFYKNGRLRLIFRDPKKG